MSLSATTLTVARSAESSAKPQIRIEEVRDYQAFLNLEPAWNELVEQAGVDHPFLEHVWIRTWWECFGAGSSLRVLVVRAGSQPIAIAPLIVTSARMWGIPVRRLGFFYNSHVPRADFIIAQRADEVYRAIWAHLRVSSGWDVLQLCQLPVDSPTLESLRRLAEADGHPAGVWRSGASPYLTPCCSWEEHWNQLTPKHRSNIRNRFRRLEQIGPVGVTIVNSVSGLEDALASGLRLEAAAWKGENHTAISCDSAVRRFYEVLAQRSAPRGWLSLHFLCVGLDRIAFDYSLNYKNRIYLLKVGYNPEFAKFSPYNLLMTRVLEDVVGRGLAEYDFLGDDEPWKQSWTKQARPHCWLFVFSNRRRGRFLYWLKYRIGPFLKQHSLCRHLLGQRDQRQARRKSATDADGGN